MTPDTAVELVGAFLLVLTALVVVTAMLKPLWLPVWHLFRGTQQFLEDWFGEPPDSVRGTKGRPSVMSRLAQLETNSGSTMRDAVSRIEEKVEVLQTYAAQNRTAAQEAKVAAHEAVDEAKLAASVAQATAHERRQDVANLHGAMSHMRQEIGEEAAQRYADALELLAEHGGPDLRPHVPPVQPHAHALPTHETPSLTGGPVQPKDEEQSDATPPQ